MTQCMKMWVARDNDFDLYLYNAKPIWVERIGGWTPSNESCSLDLFDLDEQFKELGIGECIEVMLTHFVKEKSA